MARGGARAEADSRVHAPRRTLGSRSETDARVHAPRRTLRSRSETDAPFTLRDGRNLFDAPRRTLRSRSETAQCPPGDHGNTADTAWQYCLGSPSGHRAASALPLLHAELYRRNAVPFQQSPARAPARATELTRTEPSEWAGLPRARAEAELPGSIGNSAMVARRAVRPASPPRNEPPAGAAGCSRV